VVLLPQAARQNAVRGRNQVFDLTGSQQDSPPMFYVKKAVMPNAYYMYFQDK
jgi:hypothetical protein